jgi:2-polyprenyl-6-methoxyphenol hydroxylase-like FAD-dependent oxidoreductase
MLQNRWPEPKLVDTGVAEVPELSTTELRDVEVIIVGAGPTGLMLAAELCLAGVRPLVLERRPGQLETLRAIGFGERSVQLLRYRGLLSRAEAASIGPIHTPPVYRSATCTSTSRR